MLKKALKATVKNLYQIIRDEYTLNEKINLNHLTKTFLVFLEEGKSNDMILRQRAKEFVSTVNQKIVAAGVTLPEDARKLIDTIERLSTAGSASLFHFLVFRFLKLSLG
ncbi:hypothetical protein [Streptococcus pacificus]|uniref:Uncharacterized protein n=1 Tax=Streptococcus pacificus TaxID=2740577 RepID=A0ABS0ZJK3_9STRE|nr:hypothetical protein [Streptococcus pacificus]MBJ8326053.1 hypothetical protein [Streptococcus pacificus]